MHEPADRIDIRQKLAAESGVLTWTELQRHFARGAVIVVQEGLDLLAVAEAMARDETARLRDWLAAGQVRRVDDALARQWAPANPAFRAVVVAPWVLVQERVAKPALH